MPSEQLSHLRWATPYGPETEPTFTVALINQSGRVAGALGLQARITSIDLIDTVATVRLELDNWIGHRYTDLFTLLKVDGEWKIMNKVFHLHP